jgi:hypothetical protein
MGESERARHLSDQTFAFLGFAFAAFTPQLAVLAALAVSPVRSVPLAVH